MSGNTTNMAVGFVIAPRVAAVSASLLAGFVTGVIAGSLLATLVGRYRKPVILLLVGIILDIAGLSGDSAFAVIALTFAMGAANGIFLRDGEVSIGITYMTGTLVKFGQHFANHLTGRRSWLWVPYLVLWCGLVAGGVMGSVLWPRLGMAGLWIPGAATWLLAVYAAFIGPAEQTA